MREITLPVDFEVRMCHWYIKAFTPLSPISTNKVSRLIPINILKFYTDDVPPVVNPGEGPGGPPPPLIFRPN